MLGLRPMKAVLRYIYGTDEHARRDPVAKAGSLEAAIARLGSSADGLKAEVQRKPSFAEAMDDLAESLR